MPNVVNLLVDQGANFDVAIVIDANSVNIASYSIQAAFRKDQYSEEVIYFTSNVSATGVILSLRPEDTANVEAGKYAYDVFLVDNANNQVKLVEGQLILNPRITPFVHANN